MSTEYRVMRRIPVGVTGRDAVSFETDDLAAANREAKDLRDMYATEYPNDPDWGSVEVWVESREVSDWAPTSGANNDPAHGHIQNNEGTTR